MDPVLWAEAVSAMADTLMTLNPAERPLIEANNGTYQLQLQELNAYISSQAAGVNQSRRFLITPHDSFSYFASRYGFREQSLEGISTDSEAGIREIDDMAHFLRDNDIRTIFTESTTSDSGMLAVIDAARALGQSVSIGGQLSALTGPGQGYIDLMEANADTIVGGILSPPPPQTSVLPVSWTFIAAMVVAATGRRRSW